MKYHSVIWNRCLKMYSVCPVWRFMINCQQFLKSWKKYDRQRVIKWILHYLNVVGYIITRISDKIIWSINHLMGAKWSEALCWMAVHIPVMRRLDEFRCHEWKVGKVPTHSSTSTTAEDSIWKRAFKRGQVSRGKLTCQSSLLDLDPCLWCLSLELLCLKSCLPKTASDPTTKICPYLKIKSIILAIY